MYVVGWASGGFIADGGNVMKVAVVCSYDRDCLRRLDRVEIHVIHCLPK